MMNLDNYFSYEEQALLELYDPTSRDGFIADLRQARHYIDPEDKDVIALVDGAIEKLAAMTDDEFAALEIAFVTP